MLEVEWGCWTWKSLCGECLITLHNRALLMLGSECRSRAFHEHYETGLTNIDCTLPTIPADKFSVTCFLRAGFLPRAPNLRRLHQLLQRRTQQRPSQLPGGRSSWRISPNSSSWRISPAWTISPNYSNFANYANYANYSKYANYSILRITHITKITQITQVFMKIIFWKTLEFFKVIIEKLELNYLNSKPSHRFIFYIFFKGIVVRFIF